MNAILNFNKFFKNQYSMRIEWFQKVSLYKNQTKIMHGIYFIVKQYSHSGYLFMLKAQSVAVIVILMRIIHVMNFVTDIQTLFEEANAKNKLKYQHS